MSNPNAQPIRIRNPPFLFESRGTFSFACRVTIKPKNSEYMEFSTIYRIDIEPGYHSKKVPLKKRWCANWDHDLSMKELNCFFTYFEKLFDLILQYRPFFVSLLFNFRITYLREILHFIVNFDSSKCYAWGKMPRSTWLFYIICNTFCKYLTPTGIHPCY